jgi:hypothetical protein
MKNCNKCNEVKSYEFFNKHPYCKDGYLTICKSCASKQKKENYLKNKDKNIEYRIKNKEKINEYAKEYRLNNKEYYKDKNKEYRLNNEKYNKEYYLKNKEKLVEKNKEYYLKNKEYFKEYHNVYQKKYSELNKEKIAKNKKEYYLKNKEKITKKRNEWRNNKFKNNYLFKLRCNIACLISNSIKKQGYSKKSKTYQILGCTFEEFKTYIEIQFTKGMSWKNHGEWHYDHIYPVSLAKNEEELLKLNHYTNFQPMWAKENIIKGNKIIEKQLTLL